jgi:hypothetical protein
MVKNNEKNLNEMKMINFIYRFYGIPKMGITWNKVLGIYKAMQN